MTKYALLLLLSGLFITIRSFSQVNPPVPTPSKVRGSVHGIVFDSTTGKQPLANATIGVLAVGGDSTEAEFVISDKKGFFSLKGLKPGQYRLTISFESFQPIIKTFTISETNTDADLATLYMHLSDNTLEAVVVQRPPMTVKKDTVEYNASMFAVKPNAVAEDLLRKMPGVQVDKSGTITAQGETVSRVMVDGKRFFSDDPKLATRNLPPDIIDKIQVFDDLSDQSKFTGFDDGNRVKTINIVTKKNSRKGYFGKVVAGVGTNENYDESINMHRFDGDQQISVLAQANDINKQNFTPQDIFGSSGGSGGRRGGGGGPAASTSPTSTGVTTVWAAGGNYRNSFGPKTDLTASYFYNNEHVSLTQKDSSLSSVSDTSTKISSGGSYSVNKIENHRIAVNLETKLDSSNSLVFRPNITFQKSTPFGNSNTYTTDEKSNPVLSQIGHTSSTNSGFNINGSNLQFRHKFAKPGRTISLDVNGTVNINNGSGYNYSVNTQYGTTGTVATTLNQFYNDSLHSVSLTPTLSYTEPLGKSVMLQLSYNHGYTKSTTINNTYAYDDATKGFTHFDSLFSNSYKFRSNADQASLALRLQRKKFNLSVGSGLQWTSFNSDNTTKNITVAHDYVNLTPTVNFQYNVSSTQHFRLFYNGRTGTPTPAQLQPLTTTSDSINFTTGNPNLKPQFTHSLRILYTNFNPSTQRVIFATINATTTVNDIQSAIYYNSNLGTVTNYVNLGGTYNISGFFNYGFPLKRPKSNLNWITNVSYSQSQTLRATDSTAASLNQYSHLYTKNTVLSETLSWTTNIRKNFDMNLSAASSYTIPRIPGAGAGTVKSDSSTSKTANSNLNSFSETISAEFTAYTNNGWLIAATFDYIYTYNHSSTYNSSVPLFTPSIAKQLFKKKNGELRLTVFDVLDKNTYVTKSVGTGTVSYQRTNVLSRYAMLTFTYNLNNFAGTNQRRMPGMFQGRFRDGGGGGGFRGGGPGGLYPLY